MTHPISRIYATRADADAAIADLGKGGFRADEIFVVEPPAGQLAAFAQDRRAVVEEIADRIAKGCILRRDAVAYAEHVAKGAVFVTVYASFGSGRKAETILDRHDPVESGVSAPAPKRVRYDEATPLSSTLRLPVLSTHPEPCGGFLGLPSVLSPDSPLLRNSTVFHAPAPLSGALGLPVMTADGAPTSSSLGLPSVTADGKPTSSKFGLPTVTAGGRPTSSSFGLPTVTAKGAPTGFGLPLLWRRGRPGRGGPGVGRR